MDRTTKTTSSRLCLSKVAGCSTRRRFIGVCLVWAIVPAAMAFPSAYGLQDHEFLTGNRLQTVMAERTSIAVSGSTLLPMLQQLGRDQRICLILDRRIDPHTVLRAETGFASRHQVLKSLLPNDLSMDVVVSERVVLIGPASSVHRLPVLIRWHEQVLAEVTRAMPATQRVQWKRAQPRSLSMLSEPRGLLETAMKESGLSLINGLDVPHDVWAAADWPPMPISEFAAVILNQFDLALVAGEQPGQLQLVPVATLPAFELKYVVGRTRAREEERTFQRWVDSGQLRWAGGTARLTGTVDEHAGFERLLLRLRDPDSAESEDWVPITDRTFTLKVERVTVQTLIASLRAQQVPVEVIGENEPRTAPLLQREIRIDVTAATAESFFKTAFGDVFQSIQVQPDRVILTP
jgi:hypothetical protein